MNFSRVASDKPSTLSASRLTNSANDLIFFAGQSGLVQYNTSASFAASIFVSARRTMRGDILHAALCQVFRDLRNDHIGFINGDLITDPER